MSRIPTCDRWKGVRKGLGKVSGGEEGGGEGEGGRGELDVSNVIRISITHIHHLYYLCLLTFFISYIHSLSLIFKL